MKIRFVALSTIAVISAASAHAGEYVCKVYCNGGTTTVVVSAGSSSEAAKKVDPTPVANQICKDAGKGNASSSTMSGNQCSAK